MAVKTEGSGFSCRFTEKMAVQTLGAAGQKQDGIHPVHIGFHNPSQLLMIIAAKSSECKFCRRDSNMDVRTEIIMG